MRRVLPARGGRIAAAGALLAAVMVALAVVGSTGEADEPPAPPQALDRIADRNDEAAVDAAARMKRESEVAAAAADARIAGEVDDR